MATTHLMNQSLNFLHQRLADETVQTFSVEKRRRLLGLLLLFGLGNGHNDDNYRYEQTPPHTGRVWKVKPKINVNQDFTRTNADN